MRKIVPHLQPDQLLFFNFNLESQDKNALPAAWLTAKVLRAIWLARTQKKATNIQTTRAALEANIMLLRKTRFTTSAPTLENLIAIN